MSRARTSRSNTAGPRTSSIGCRRWRPIWFAGRSRVDRRARRHRSGHRSQGGNHDDSHRLHRPRRPGQARACRQPRPAGRQPDRRQFFHRRVGGEAAGTPARAGARSDSRRRASSIRPILRVRSRTLRDAESAARAMGLQIQIFNASTSREINAAFATFARERPDALFVSPGPLLHQSGVSNLPRWRHAMRSPRRFRGATMPKPAG